MEFIKKLSSLEGAGHGACAPERNAHILLLVILMFFICALVWAAWAEIDEVTSGIGKVIPSRQIQVVQNLEGGIVSKIHVQEGDVVESGQVILQIDDTRFSSSYREGRSGYLARLAQIARLQAEVDGKEFSAPKEVIAERPDLADSERALFKSRRNELESSVGVLESQVDQRQQEVDQLDAQRRKVERSLGLAESELKITEPMVADGIMSQVELLRLRREVNDLRGALEAGRLEVSQARAAHMESRKKIEEHRLRFQAEAMNQLSIQKDELARAGESLRADEDRVVRTTVRSPVKGTVKRLMVATVGGVVQPGMDLAEIVPLEDSLVVEARIRPADIAFLHPGQDATVKISAYDYAIYGGLEGRLEHISADSIQDERGDSYYLIRLRTQRSYLGSEQNPLRIIPGMTASIDILTGKKTVLDYLLKPINRARERALRER